MIYISVANACKVGAFMSLRHISCCILEIADHKHEKLVNIIYCNTLSSFLTELPSLMSNSSLLHVSETVTCIFVKLDDTVKHGQIVYCEQEWQL